DGWIDVSRGRAYAAAASLRSVTEIMEIVDFFFSSRRRHTRSKRDWSSDVCSSDLDAELRHGEQPGGDLAQASSGRDETAAREDRSEERRVGKECRSQREEEE